MGGVGYKTSIRDDSDIMSSLDGEEGQNITLDYSFIGGWAKINQVTIFLFKCIVPYQKL